MVGYVQERRSRKNSEMMTVLEKPQVQGGQILRNEAYSDVRRSDEGCRPTPQMGLLRERQKKKRGESGAISVVILAVLLLLAMIVPAGCARKMIAREDALYHENKGDQFYEKDDFESALKEYAKALEMGSQKLKTYNNLGNVYFRRGQYDLAEKYYQMALAIDASYLFSLNNLALTHERQKDYSAAKNLLTGVLKKSPGSAILHNTLGQILIKDGDLESGVEYLKKAVEINPDYAIALNNLADVFLKNPALGEDPMPYIMRAIEKNPNNLLFYDTLGWYYCQVGIFDEALIALGKAFVHDPENVEIRVHYATVLEWLGKKKEAMDQWKEITGMPGDKDLTNLANRYYWELKGR